MCVCYFRLQRTEFEVAGGCHTCYICVTTFFLLSLLREGGVPVGGGGR